MLTIWLVHVVIPNVCQRGDVIFKITLIFDQLSFMAVIATLINMELDDKLFFFSFISCHQTIET